VLNARAFPFDELYPLCVSLDTAPHISAHDWWPSWAADPYDYLYGMFHSKAIGIFNWAFYENKEVDRLIEEANKISMINRDKSIELYKQVQRILVEEAVTIYVVQRKALSICRSWVHGFSYNPNYEAYYSYYDMYKEV
jgi:peptide/nickel transport system substrate-binding protein